VTETALITDLTGQDGSYLAELPLSKATRSTASSVGHPDSMPSDWMTSTRIRSTRGVTSTCPTEPKASAQFANAMAEQSSRTLFRPDRARAQPWWCSRPAAPIWRRALGSNPRAFKARRAQRS